VGARTLAGPSGPDPQTGIDRAGDAQRRSLSLPAGAHAQTAAARHRIERRAVGRVPGADRGIPPANENRVVDRTRFRRERQAQEISCVLRVAPYNPPMKQLTALTL